MASIEPKENYGRLIIWEAICLTDYLIKILVSSGIYFSRIRFVGRIDSDGNI